MLSSNMLLLNLISLIDVTFSTPTNDSTQNAPAGILSAMAWFHQLHCVARLLPGRCALILAFIHVTCRVRLSGAC